MKVRTIIRTIGGETIDVGRTTLDSTPVVALLIDNGKDAAEAYLSPSDARAHVAAILAVLEQIEARR